MEPTQSPSSVSSPLDGHHALFDAPQRRSSTSSSDTAEHNGAPVMPLGSSDTTSKPHAAAATASAHGVEVPHLDFTKLQSTQAAPSNATTVTATTPAKTIEPTGHHEHHHSASPTLTVAPALSPASSSMSPPSAVASAVYSTFSYEEVMSPRHQNGMRYLGGSLQHRVSIAGGFLKSWKRKYFRLRDHGIVCYKSRDDASPLFEILFKAHSVLQLGKLSGSGTDAASPSAPSPLARGASAPGDSKFDLAPTATAAPKTKATAASLVFILKHVEIVGHETPAAKVDVPLYLRAESSSDYANWIESVRLKLEARKRALTHASVHAVASSSSNSRHDSCVDERSLHVGLDRSNSAPSSSEASASASSAGATESEAPGAASPRLASSSPRPVAAAPDPPAFETFESKYLLMKEIGEGSFSIVHKAVNRVTGTLCAVKCCKYSPALDDEVRIMQSLAHPNIVGIEGVYRESNGMFFVVMDLMDDGDLCDRLIARQRLSEPEAQLIVAQVLQGLAYLHDRTILHRDIKPENILLHGKAVKIADFGLAKQLPTATSMLKRSCGTLEYAAPELLMGQPYGLKSDIFSLGVVLYVLLFGTFPFSIESAAALQCMDRFPEGVDVRDMSCLSRENVQWRSVSAHAQDVILKMLAPRERDRVSARDLLTHPWFDPAVLHIPTALAPTASGTRPRRDSNTWKVRELHAATHERARLVDCAERGFRELLSRGLDVVKWSYKGSTAPHATTLAIDFVEQVVTWTARASALARSDSKRAIRLRDVDAIRVGHATEAFARAAAKAKDASVPAPELCLSIVCPRRTLDIVVKVPSQRAFVVRGLTQLLRPEVQQQQQQIATLSASEDAQDATERACIKV